MSLIIVVEDDPHILRVISLWLTRQGHEVLEASNGHAALELVEQHTPDVVITDVNMPGMDGFELLNQLEERGRRPRGALVLTSRWDHREIAEHLAERGVRVMPKPFSPTLLAEFVNELIADDESTPSASGVEGGER